MRQSGQSLLLVLVVHLGLFHLLQGPTRCVVDAGRIDFTSDTLEEEDDSSSNDKEENSLPLSVAAVAGGDYHGAKASKTNHNSYRHRKYGPNRLSPIVFLPGTGGSRLEAKMTDNKYKPPKGCATEDGWFRLWLDIMYIFTGDVHCWVDAMKLHYNTTRRRSSNAPGLDVRVPAFGVTDAIEYIDPSWAAWVVGNVGMYAAPLVNKLQEWGYERNLNIRGAPYDFRYAPHSNAHFFSSLRKLIEETYENNGRTRVTLMAHSMGGLFALYFLNHQPQAWKDHYIHRFISMNTPWKGTVFITKALATGINFGKSSIDPWDIRDQQRSQETAPLLLPSTSLWHDKEVVLTTPHRKYNARDLRNAFFDDIGFPVGKDMARNLRNADYIQGNPGVKMLCLYTYGVPTPERFVYRAPFTRAKHPARTVMGQGDGTVNYRSLRGCRFLQRKSHWRQTPHKQRVYIRGYEGPGHDGIFTDPRVHKLLKKALLQA